MGLRITTWNVNGIRNPFGYAPWNQKRTYQAMFEILEADIVIMQEAKIQRKDLTDDMVLVAGWDVFFSLPRDKKGYSGVAIYTRNSKCAPIRAEEGITGVLCPPKSNTMFRDLPAHQQIGGYPRTDQLLGPIDEVMLDSEGRTVILEFPAFVLIGVYVPATRDDSRTDFRIGFLTALDARIRNLAAMGKQVILAGDLNIIRSDFDTAGCAEHLRKEGMTLEEFMSTPSRRLFNQLVFEGQVIGEKDEGREQPVMWDTTRCFHPDRPGMYTCWETKKNARPGNFGSRIDYILCSAGMKDWVEDANIQEGLIGSDHCPVYATLAERVKYGEEDRCITDIMNPVGMFQHGQRLREWDVKDLLPQSAKLLNEFDRRRSIKDMFSKKPALPKLSQTVAEVTTAESSNSFDKISNTQASTADLSPKPGATPTPSNADVSSPKNSVAASQTPPSKRTAPSSSIQPLKKAKTSVTKDKDKLRTNQRSLKGFFKPRTPVLEKAEQQQDEEESAAAVTTATTFAAKRPVASSSQLEVTNDGAGQDSGRLAEDDTADEELAELGGDKVFDPIESKESWSKLLGKKRAAPLCEHEEPCISYQTKKPGVNKGRSFYMCSRPLGPSGQKERGTQWRCGTFIWQSDWKGP
ncbi:unnamed protein product [Discula destructiva]